MQYKKYRGRTFQEARLKMVMDVGNRGYIVSQRRYKEGGLWGLFGKGMIELTVGLMMGEMSEVGSGKGKGFRGGIGGYDRNGYEGKGYEGDGYEKKGYDRKGYEGDGYEKKGYDRKEYDRKDNVAEELNEIKGLIGKLMEGKVLEGGGGGIMEGGVLERNKEYVKVLLKDEGFDKGFIDAICSLTSIEMMLSREKEMGKIKEILRKEIMSIIEISEGISIERGKKKVFVLVGPTGVGKTTTLAKLGAYFGVFQKKRVKFISIDTYRVGAIQQLKLYADIMGISFVKINGKEDLKLEVETSQSDLILVDTAGRSQRNREGVREIKEYLELIEDVHISLVVSATTQYKDLVEILDEFDILNYWSIIVTKLDETSSIGGILSALGKKKRKLSYVTFGQSVPEDIEEASGGKLLGMIFQKNGI